MKSKIGIIGEITNDGMESNSSFQFTSLSADLNKILLNSIEFDDKKTINTNSSLNSQSNVSNPKNSIQNKELLVHANSNFSYSNDDSDSDFLNTENEPLFKNIDKSFSSFSCSYNNSSNNDGIENNKKNDNLHNNNLTPLTNKKKPFDKHKNSSNNKNESYMNFTSNVLFNI